MQNSMVRYVRHQQRFKLSIDLNDHERADFEAHATLRIGNNLEFSLPVLFSKVPLFEHETLMKLPPSLMSLLGVYVPHGYVLIVDKKFVRLPLKSQLAFALVAAGHVLLGHRHTCIEWKDENYRALSRKAKLLWQVLSTENVYRQTYHIQDVLAATEWACQYCSAADLLSGIVLSRRKTKKDNPMEVLKQSDTGWLAAIIQASAKKFVFKLNAKGWKEYQELMSHMQYN